MRNMLSERQLQNVWHIKDFDSPRKAKIIMSEMPDYESYLKDKQKISAKKTRSEYRFLNVEPLLTRKQEYHLFRQYNYLKYKIINGKPKQEYLDKIKAIRDVLVCSNSKLVMMVTKQQSYKDFEYALSDGIYGLVDAVDLFDFRKNIKFSTYAYWCVMSKVRTFSQLDLQEDKFVPSIQDEALIEFPSSGDFNDVTDNEQRELIKENLKCLTERERQVVNLYFGLDRRPTGKMGLKEIAEVLRITKQRVDQIKEMALRKIHLKLMELKEYEKERLPLYC